IDTRDASPIAVEQSPLIGFGRVAALELPDLRPRLVDLDAATVERARDASTALAYEIAADSADGEVAYRGGKRLVARLVRRDSLITPSAVGDSHQLQTPRGPFQLRITKTGSLDALRFVPVEREPCAPA